MKDRRDWEMRKAMIRRIQAMRYVWVYGEVSLEKYSEIEVTGMEEKEAWPGWLFITLGLSVVDSGATHWEFPIIRDGHLGVTDEVGLCD